MSEWNSKNKPGVKSRNPEYPDLTEDFQNPINSNDEYRGKDRLVGWYRFLGYDAIGRVDGGTTNSFPNLALTGSSGQTLTTAGVITSPAVYYAENKYGAAVSYKAHFQSPFSHPGEASPTDLWANSFNEQVTPYLPTNMAQGALPFSGSKANKNYFKITNAIGNTGNKWPLGNSSNAADNSWTISCWVKRNNYNKYQQEVAVAPIIQFVQPSTTVAAGGQLTLYWSGTSSKTSIQAVSITNVAKYYVVRSPYWGNSGTQNFDDSTSTPQSNPADGTWVHIVWTQNGAGTASEGTYPLGTSTDSGHLWINGIHSTLSYTNTGGFTGQVRDLLDGELTSDIYINGPYNNTDPTDASEYTNQDIAEVAIWNRVLHPSEIRSLYNGTTMGIKKWDTGIVKNPPIPQLQKLDNTSGNAYPTIGGSANQYRLGKRKVHFDDTLTRVFTQSNGSVNMGARLRSDDKLLSASFSTPNKLPTLTVGVTGNSENAGRIDARIMGNLPFLTASVTEFKDRYNPFDDTSAPPRSDGHFYLTGSLMVPSLNVRLADKAKVTIPLNNTRATFVGANSSTKAFGGHTHPGTGGGSNEYGEYQLMVYWNAEESRWEKHGRGMGYTNNTGNDYFSEAGGALAAVAKGGGTQAEGFQQRNVNVAACGFSPSQAFVFKRSAESEGGAITYDGKVALKGAARPISTYGFPFDARYHATSSQQIKMSDYIDAPFLLEKCEWHYSGSVKTAAIGAGACNLLVADNQYEHGGGGTGLLPTTVNNTTFFILRQRPGAFSYSEMSTTYDSFGSDGSKRVLYKTRLTSSIPGKRCTNLDGINNQTNYEMIYDTRDLITYDQHTVVWKESNLAGVTSRIMPNFDIDGVNSPATLNDILRDGVGRGLSTVIESGKLGKTAASGGPPLTFHGNPDSGGYVYGGATSTGDPRINSVRGSFVVTGSCKTSAINRGGIVPITSVVTTPNFVGATARYCFFEQRNLLGGRMNPESRLGDRRPIIKGLASGLSASVNAVQGGLIGGMHLGYLTASAPETYAQESPYMLMPEDIIVIGAQAEAMSYRRHGWLDETAPGSISQGSMNGVVLAEAPGKLVMYGSYLKDHKTHHGSLNQQLTTNSSHGIISNGPILDQWEISAISEYSGSYLARSITGSMTSPAVGWPRAPAFEASSLWASASSTPRPGAAVGTLGLTGSAYSDIGGPFDGSIKPWVSSSAYHSSSLFGRYFASYIKPGLQTVSGSYTDGDGDTVNTVNAMVDSFSPFAADNKWNATSPTQTTELGRVVAREPASTREVAATVYESLAVHNTNYARRSPGDTFGFHRNVRLSCAEETYYDSLVPDPIQCWLADNQTKLFNGDSLVDTFEAGNTGSLGIGKSARGSQTGGDGVGTYNGYTNEHWIPSFPYEAKYRGFQEPPIDELKRRSNHNELMNVVFAAPSYNMAGAYSASAPTQNGCPQPSWNGFDPKGANNSSDAYSYLSGFISVSVDGKKPGIQQVDVSGTGAGSGLPHEATNKMNYITARTSPDETVLPALFGFGTGPYGAMNTWKRVAGTQSTATEGGDGRFFFVASKQRGCKYGLYSWKPRATSTIFRSNKFGQMRDMLEQRKYSRFFIQSDSAVETNAPVICQFKEPVWLDPISDSDKAAFDTQCSNLSTFATSSVPYFDGEVKNRGPLVADGSDTIVIE